MATETPATTWKSHPSARPSGPLWQVPVFFIGIVVLGMVCLSRPVWSHAHYETRQVEKTLAEARRLMDRKEGDVERMIALLDPILQQSARFPDAQGEAHLLLGHAYTRGSAHDEGS